MPIYMDRHDLPSEITPEALAELHQKDLAIEHKHDCRGFTYWLDLEKKYAFCLIEAPNKEAVYNMHHESHGDLPTKIIEVEPTIVGSFLGRISDPEKAKDIELNIINDPAFRTIMVIETGNYLNRTEGNQYNVFTQKFHNSVTKTLNHFEGRIVKQDNTSYLVSFKSVSSAILCAIKIYSNIKYITPKFEKAFRNLKIGLTSGVPLAKDDEKIFEETITLATRMCDVIKNPIVITNELKKLYESENKNAYIDQDLIRTLKPNEKDFLTKLMNYLEVTWHDVSLNIEKFSSDLGYSKSQLNRKLKSLTGKSPNNFIMDYRLNNALKLLHDQKGNISEIAFETGFNSLAYFSKCFKKKFKILPSKYLQQHIY